MNEPSGKYFRFLPRFDAAILALRSAEYGSISPDAVRSLRVAIARSMASFGIVQLSNRLCSSRSKADFDSRCLVVSDRFLPVILAAMRSLVSSLCALGARNFEPPLCRFNQSLRPAASSRESTLCSHSNAFFELLKTFRTATSNESTPYSSINALTFDDDVKYVDHRTLGSQPFSNLTP